MGLQRWFYAGGHPNRVARILDRCTAAFSALGAGPEYLVTLEVPGRRTGRIVGLPLVVAAVDGERYLVSMLGEKVNWVRNVKAAGGDVTLRHGRREGVQLEEVAPDRRAPVLKAYLKRAPNARAHLPIDKDAPLAEFERVSSRFPVFRVVTRNTP
ncbi:MAG: nitroreductase/quinone reductase family protein [Rubrobacter sp.]